MTHERDSRISFVLAVMIGSGAFLLGLLAADALSYDRTTGELAGHYRAEQASELPPEWVWEREAITFDHMFRKDQASRRPQSLP